MLLWNSPFFNGKYWPSISCTVLSDLNASCGGCGDSAVVSLAGSAPVALFSPLLAAEHQAAASQHGSLLTVLGVLWHAGS